MVNNMETLICKEGNHEFTRQRVRGRKPSFCPEHKPETYTGPKLSKEEKTKRQQEGRKAKRMQDAEGAIERVKNFQEWVRGTAAHDRAVNLGAEYIPVKPKYPMVTPTDADYVLARQVGAIK